MNITEILKSFFKIFVHILVTFIKENWESFYTTILKMLLVSLCLWLFCQFVPHGILLLNNISFWGWFSIICVYRLITLKYDDFETIDDVPLNINDSDDDEMQEMQEKPTLGNIIGKDNEDDSGSTRE